MSDPARKPDAASVVEAPPPESLTIPKIRPLVIWAVSDGRAGIKNQALGLAEAVERRLADSSFQPQVVTRDIAYRTLFDRWPTSLRLFPDKMLKRNSDPLDPPWPDLWIGCGRATLPHSMRMRTRSHGKTLVVQLQAPRTSLKPFDLVIAPEHDQVKGDNALSLIGSTNRITPEKMRGEYERWQDRIEAFKGPYVCVLIGGESKVHALSEERAQTLGQQIKSAIRGIKGTLLLTFSRRTPEPARQALRQALKDLPGIIYDGNGDNPYFAFLAAAEHILVTEDSVNMATEAASTGKPIYILGLDRKPGLMGNTPGASKFDQFHLSMQQKGITRPFSCDLRGSGYVPLNETARAADAVLDLLRVRLPEL